MLLLLWCSDFAITIVGRCSDCTWREGRHGDKDVDKGRVKVFDYAKGLLLICNSRLLCCCLRVMIAIAIVGLRSGCAWREGCVGNDLDSGRVHIIVDDKG